MCGEFGEVTVIIDFVINFLAFVSPLCAFRDTSTYIIMYMMRIVNDNNKVEEGFPSNLVK